MNPELQKQILVGIIAMVVAGAGAFFGTNSKREERDALLASTVELQKKVDEGKFLKKQYEALLEETKSQEARIDALIKIMPTSGDVNVLPYQVKKLSDTAGLLQTSFLSKGETKKEYYTEKHMDFEFKGSFHTFGEFASQVSGYERIININSIEMTRSKESLYPAVIKCSISAFLYNADAPAPKPSAKPAAAKAPAAKED